MGLRDKFVQLKAKSEPFNVFPEITNSFYYFIAQLFQTIKVSGITHIFFLSREGQPLMHLYKMFQERIGESNTSAHYLEVSRRSTLLPSLATLEQETFDTLFRQYRQMSLFEFLSSLGLEGHCLEITKELKIPESKALERINDFPDSDLFFYLKELAFFCKVYERERLCRREAFVTYLTDLSGGTLPTRLVVVDVGWKGTIQDNLHALLCKNNDTPVKSILGYYIGLVNEGAAGPCNEKHGLLFSSVGTRTPYFHIFNENRALFEVLLAADHGSVVSYMTDKEGIARPIRGSFEEREMLNEKVFPVQRALFRNFESLLGILKPSWDGSLHCTLKDVARAHTRLVFKPTNNELHWFSSIFHVENFGVFERSYFRAPDRLNLLSRLKFVIRLLQRRYRGELGFWPWQALHEKGGRVVAFAYAAARRLQR